jgi:hypothetical protein
VLPDGFHPRPVFRLHGERAAKAEHRARARPDRLAAGASARAASTNRPLPKLLRHTHRQASTDGGAGGP